MWLTEVQKFGVAFTAGGCVFFVLGVILLFDSSLLAMGNILFLIGLSLLIGPQKTIFFFARRQKWKGSLAFAIGILLIFIKRPLFGFPIELFGIVNLFGDFFSVIVSFLRSLPLIGPLIDRISRQQRLPV